MVSLAHTASEPSVWKLLGCATNGATQTYMYQKVPTKCIQTLRMILIAHLHISVQLQLIYGVTRAPAVGSTSAVCGTPRLESGASMGAGTEKVTWKRN